MKVENQQIRKNNFGVRLSVVCILLACIVGVACWNRSHESTTATIKASIAVRERDPKGSGSTEIGQNLAGLEQNLAQGLQVKQPDLSDPAYIDPLRRINRERVAVKYAPLLRILNFQDNDKNKRVIDCLVELMTLDLDAAAVGGKFGNREEMNQWLKMRATMRKEIMTDLEIDIGPEAMQKFQRFSSLPALSLDWLAAIRDALDASSVPMALPLEAKVYEEVFKLREIDQEEFNALLKGNAVPGLSTRIASLLSKEQATKVDDLLHGYGSGYWSRSGRR